MGITRHVHDHILRGIPEASLAVGWSHDSAADCRKTCHCEPARRLVWQSPNFLGNFSTVFTSIKGIPTPVCALARNDTHFFDTLGRSHDSADHLGAVAKAAAFFVYTGAIPAK